MTIDPCIPVARALMPNGKWLRFLAKHPSWHAPAHTVMRMAVVGAMGFSCGPATAVGTPSTPDADQVNETPAAYSEAGDKYAVDISHVSFGNAGVPSSFGAGAFGAGITGVPFPFQFASAPVTGVSERGDDLDDRHIKPRRDVPEPHSVWLVIAGLAGTLILAFNRRKQKAISS